MRFSWRAKKQAGDLQRSGTSDEGEMVCRLKIQTLSFVLLAYFKSV